MANLQRALLVCLVWSAQGLADDLLVPSQFSFSDALRTAQPGDRILLAPGTHPGGQFQAGLTDVIIRSQNPASPAVIQGGVNNMQLSDARDVTIEHLIFEGATGNGLNIDDGGSFATPSTNITIRDVTVRDVGPTGNRDGIKLSGVTGFLIDRVKVFNWGDGGSAIDPVGSHNGLIQNSWFRHADGSPTVSGVRPKGGSKNITIRGNRLELFSEDQNQQIVGMGRAIQAGGSTGTQFFRFIDGDSNYEAENIVAEGNVILNSNAAFAYVNIDGGEFHHNYATQPQSRTLRILNENQGNAIVDTQNGSFTHNKIVFNGPTGSVVNIGPETLPETFTFASNQWYNLANPTPAGSTPTLPALETGGTYGIDLQLDPDGPIVWHFDWGAWIVNASENAGEVDLDGLPGLIASPGPDGMFDPRAAIPLTGTWTFSQSGIPSIHVDSFSQAILIDSTACPACTPLAGDYDGNLIVDAADYDVWHGAFGDGGPSAADGNLDGTVNAADFTVWRDYLGSEYFPPAGSAVPEPSPLCPLLVGAVYWFAHGMRRNPALSAC